MNNLITIFRNREDGFSDLTALVLSEYSEFLDLFLKLIEKRISTDVESYLLSDTQGQVAIYREFSVPRTRLDILVSSDQYELGIENKKKGYKLRKGQLLDYARYFENSEEDKTKVVILMCPSSYRPPASELPTMLFCKISYKDLRGFATQLIKRDYHYDFFKKYDEYLGEVEMSPFKGFDLDTVDYVRNSSRKFHTAENKLIADFRKSLQSILYADNGTPYFDNIIYRNDKDRRWLDREKFIGDYSAVVEFSDIQDYSIWLAFQFSEEVLNFRIYIFTPSEVIAKELRKYLLKGSIDCGFYRKEVSMALPIEVNEFSNWNLLRNKLRNFINSRLQKTLEGIQRKIEDGTKEGSG